MPDFKKIIDEIIVVYEENKTELSKAMRAFNHTPLAHNMYDHIKKYLKAQAIEHGILKDSPLSNVSSGYSSFHEDEEGDHHIHSH
jgi:hypothetical protein